MRKDLDTYANVVHGFSIQGVQSRYEDLDIVVIR
jgi:isocitrate/isopropylmalate dehydrogenase